MSYLVTLLFLTAGVVNLLPVVGIVSDQQLSSLYQIEAFGADTGLLLRHRAILFGIVGSILVYAAFTPSIRGLATLAGLVSMVSFCVLTMWLRNDNPNLLRIAWIDAGASVLLLIGYVLHRLAVGDTA